MNTILEKEYLELVPEKNSFRFYEDIYILMKIMNSLHSTVHALKNLVKKKKEEMPNIFVMW